MDYELWDKTSVNLDEQRILNLKVGRKSKSSLRLYFTFSF